MAGYISDGTTVLSNLSLTGDLKASSASASIVTASRVSSNVSIVANEVWASGVSVGSIATASRVSSSVSILGNAIWASSLSMGGFNFPTSISASSFNVIAHVVQGSASSFTVCATVTSVKKGDVLVISPLGGAGVSSISSGLVYHSHATQDGQFEFRYSNVSTLVQNQSAQTFNLVMIRL